MIAIQKNGFINALTIFSISHTTMGFPMNNGFKNSIIANINLARFNRFKK